MKIELDIPEYNSSQGIKYNWENGFKIEVKYSDGVVLIEANKEGLISLANHLLNIAQENVPQNYHLHFDEYNSLEEGSLELIIEKKD